MTEEDIDHMLQETRAQGGGARGGDWGSDLFKDRESSARSDHFTTGDDF
jgi:hypothetical protein